MFVFFTIHENVYALEVTESASEEEASDNDGFLSEIGDFIKGIIVPDDNFLETEFNKLDEKIKSKLPFKSYIETIGRFKEISNKFDGDASSLDITYEYNGKEYKTDIGVIIAPHLPKVRGIVTGIYVFLIAIYNYNQLMFLIRGSKYTNAGEVEKKE